MFSRVTQFQISLKRILLEEIKENWCSSAFSCLMSSLLLGYISWTVSSIQDLLTLKACKNIFESQRESRNQALCMIKIFITTEIMWVIPVHPLGFHVPVSKSISWIGSGSIGDQPKLKLSREASLQPRFKVKKEAQYWPFWRQQFGGRREKRILSLEVCVHMYVHVYLHVYACV